MSDYLDMKINIPISGTMSNNQMDSVSLPGDSNIYTQGPIQEARSIRVNDTPYVPTEKITVRKYRLYKTRETL